MAVPLRRTDYDHHAGFDVRRDDLFYDRAPRLQTDTNLALDSMTTAPAARAYPRLLPRVAADRGRLSALSKAAVFAAAIAIAGCLLLIAMGSSRVYTAREELEAMQAQLESAKAQTSVLVNELDGEVALSELYEYATTKLGMKEATKEDITYIQSLLDTEDDVTTETVTTHKPARVSFHLFG